MLHGGNLNGGEATSVGNAHPIWTAFNYNSKTAQVTCRAVGKLENGFFSPQAKIRADLHGDVNTKVVMPYILIISLPEDTSFRVSIFFVAMCKKKAHAFRLLNNNGSKKTLGVCLQKKLSKIGNGNRHLSSLYIFASSDGFPLQPGWP